MCNANERQVNVTTDNNELTPTVVKIIRSDNEHTVHSNKYFNV